MNETAATEKTPAAWEGVPGWVRLRARDLAPFATLVLLILFFGTTFATALGHADARLPLEVQPLVRALNALLERLAIALDTQKAFVADAAHELRTPLAAVQIQSQLAWSLISRARMET